MKKFLLLLLLAAAAWGFYEGSQESGTIQPAGRPAAEASSGRSGGVTEIFRTIVRGASDLPFGELLDRAEETPAAPAAPSSAAPSENPQTAASPDPGLTEVFHFKDAVESRIDRSRFIPSAEIPPLLKNAIVAAEDRRFYDHGAIDIVSVGRAAVANSMAGTTVEGGSTLAQQTVKNLFLSDERTFSRKLRELVLAVQLEKYYTKDQILELYLNTIYFGHGTYGIRDACRTYFNKEPKDLTIAQCAMIAGLPQAPSAYDPIDHPAEAKKRMSIVLMLMAKEGYITPQEAAAAAMEAILE